MIDHSENLRIALLGMSDNRITEDLVRFLGEEGVKLDVLILQSPNFKGNLARLKRKFAAAGFIATLRRMSYAVTKVVARRFGGAGSSSSVEKNETILVRDPNGDDVKKILEERNIDVLLLSTDSIIRRSVFSTPKRATLNAHPGKLPQYRGLGGLAVQVARGIAPSMSVHIVNEGIDTGPVLLREELPTRILDVNQTEREQILTAWQAKLFARTLQNIASGTATVIDTFLEPSNMTRGVTRAFAERAWAGSSSRGKG